MAASGSKQQADQISEINKWRLKWRLLLANERVNFRFVSLLLPNPSRRSAGGAKVGAILVSRLASLMINTASYSGASEMGEISVWLGAGRRRATSLALARRAGAGCRGAAGRAGGGRRGGACGPDGVARARPPIARRVRAQPRAPAASESGGRARPRAGAASDHRDAARLPAL